VSTPAFTAGYFDGVHIGHRRVLDALLAHDPHGRVFLFAGDREGAPALTPLERRVELLEEAGIASVEVHGRPGGVRADPQASYVAGPRKHVRWPAARTIEVPLVEGVSSERIRTLVAARELAAAAELLGRPFDVEGIVVEGAKRGRLLGFPTANLAVPPGLLVPPNGIYAGAARGRPAAISIGTNPHYGGTERTVEAFLLDFDGDLYGQRLRLELWEHLRDEAAFASEAELVAQIARDVERTRAARRPA
jgi:FAD synthase